MDRDRAVHQPRADLQRGADDDDRHQLAARLTQGLNRVEHSLQQGGLQHEVIQGVAGEAEFREDGESHLLIVQVTQGLKVARRVLGRVGESDGQRHRGDAGEAMVVDRCVRVADLGLPCLAGCGSAWGGICVSGAHGPEPSCGRSSPVRRHPQPVDGAPGLIYD